MGQVAETFRLYREFKKVHSKCKKKPKLREHMNNFIKECGLEEKFKAGEVVARDYNILIAEYNRIKNDY